MSTRLALLLCVCAILVGSACASDDPQSTTERTRATSSALTQVGLRPLPARENDHGLLESAWGGDDVDLLVADAMAECVGDNLFYDDETYDEYLKIVENQMLWAGCGPLNHGFSFVNSYSAWRAQRADPECNVVPGTQTKAFINLGSNSITLPFEKLYHDDLNDCSYDVVNDGTICSRSMDLEGICPCVPISDAPMQIAINGAYDSPGCEGTDLQIRSCSAIAVESANDAFERPARHLCIAQKIREAMPGTAAAGGLYMSSASLRKLADVGRRLAQQAVVGYAKLGIVFTSPENWTPSWPASISTFAELADAAVKGPQYLYLLNKWAELNPDEIERAGSDFAAAVQLLTYFLRDELAMLHRDAWARTYHGVAGDGDALDFWGSGSFTQRYHAALHGGRVLSIAAENEPVSPWRIGVPDNQFVGMPTPQPAGDQLDWPSFTHPYVALRIEQPEVLRFEDLVQQYDQRTFITKPGALSLVGCEVVDDDIENVKVLYTAVETEFREATGNDWPGLPPDPETSPEEFLLLTRLGIGLGHAQTFYTYMQQLLGEICPNPIGVPMTHQVAGTLTLDEAFGISFVALGKDTVLHPLDETQIVPNYARQSRMRMPIANLATGIPFEVDARDLEMPVRPELGGALDYETWELSLGDGIVGSNAGLTAARFALIDALNLQPLQHEFFVHAREVMNVIGTTVGTESVALRPVALVDTSTATGVPELVQRIDVNDDGRLWRLDVTFGDDDEFWAAIRDQDDYDVYVVPDNPHAGVLARFPSTTLELGSLPPTITDLLQGLPSYHINGANLVPGTDPALYWAHTDIELPPDSFRHTVIVKRTSNYQGGGPAAYRVLADGLFYTSGTSSTPAWSTTVRHGYYHAFGGTTGQDEARMRQTKVRNRSLAAIDPFGFHRDRVPLGNPDDYLGDGMPDAASHWLAKGTQASEEATAAIKIALDGLIAQQSDEALLAAEQAKSTALQKLEREELCGAAASNGCDSSDLLVNMDLVVATDFGECGVSPAEPTLPVWDEMEDEDVNEWLTNFTAYHVHQINCAEINLKKLTNATLPIAAAVSAQRDALTQPAFQEFAGGALQDAFIAQWAALKTVEKEVDALAATAELARTRVEEARAGMYTAWVTYDETQNFVEQMVAVFDCVFAVGSSVTSWVASATNLGANPVLDSGAVTATVGAVSACENAGDPPGEPEEAALWQSNDAARTAVQQGIADLAHKGSTLIAAVADVAAAGARIQQLRAQTERAQARIALEAEMALAGATTSFGVYRRYHHYDLWRAFALTENARRYGALARRATEARFVVTFDAMKEPEALVAAPSSWAPLIFGYDLNTANTVGLEVAAPSADGIHPNLVLDYFGNLERFSDGYPINHPSAAAKEDTNVLGLAGPASVVLGTDDLTIGALEWQYLCGAQWVAVPSVAFGDTDNDGQVDDVIGRHSPESLTKVCAFALDAPVCGNGVLELKEACDDGNSVNGDGCDANCIPTGCGNGVVSASELCDDGNTTSGDGCDANCAPTGCGNGIAAGSEACDDGNSQSGDGCEPACFWTPPTRARLRFRLDPWGRPNGDLVEPPYEKRYNARWTRLAVNLVGTAIRDCTFSPDPLACYAEPFVAAHLRHLAGDAWVPNYDGKMRLLELPRAHIEGFKALAAEQWLDPVSNSWGKPYVGDIARNELRERPFDGFYEIELVVTPDVRLDRIERVQVLVGSQYWVKQDWEEP